MPVIRGRSLRVAIRDGNPAWQPLLLCNGFGARLEMLQPFVDALDPQRTIIRFDMPGLGRSPAPLLPYHLATTAPLLSGILDQLGYQQADVLGISWGGGLAQQFALRCPGAPPGAGSYHTRRADGARLPPHPAAHAHAAAPPGPRLCGPHRR
jgi:pimeloyl-ACP methyl ester carboxylesterase